LLAIIPLLAYLGLLLLLGNLQPALGWRRAALRAAVVWGCVLTAMVEGLSMLNAVQQPWLVAAWALVGILIGAAAVTWFRRGHALRFPRLRWPGGRGEAVLLVGIVAVVLITGIVAWFTPPQTWDSLNYHMSRVAHWAQDRSVAPFTTGIEVQNSRTPWAEFAVLDLYVLGGGDRLVNFVQWSAMVLCLVGVSVIARDLGAPPLGQWLAAAFTVSLPMGIIQASSTTTDYVVALWLVCVAAEWSGLRRASVGKDGLAYSSLGAGLGALTKPTALAFLLPFAILIAFEAVRRWGPARAAGWGVAAAILVLTISAGHLARAYNVYGSLIEGEQFGVHANQVRDARGLVSNVLRNVGMQLGTPSPYVNKAVYQTILKVHEWIGLDLNDPRTTSAGKFAVRPPQTSEDLAGNPLQAVALLVILPLAMLSWRRTGWTPVAYGLAIVVAFLVFCFVFKWQIFGVRYHLPLFVLAAPLAGLVLGKLAWPGASVLVGAILIVASWPWLFQIDSRPLIPSPRSTIGSILTTPRQDLYFANGRYLEAPYVGLVGRIRGTGCRAIGLSLSGNSAEYPLWVLFGAPSAELKIGWIVGGTASARFVDPTFEPCAVICEDCSLGWHSPQGLPFAERRAGFTLFLGNGE
jgi:hypothetical protein